MPRLQVNERLRVRQYIISDLPNIFYTERYSLLKNTASTDWQQHVSTTPTILTNSDLESDRLYYKIHVTRPFPTMDTYNPYYTDPDYGLIPTGNSISTTKTLCVCMLSRNNNDLEPDHHGMDKASNKALSNELVDRWQTNRAPVNLLAQDHPQDDFQLKGPQVSLTTGVEARFANTLVMRTGEPGYVPLTTNHGLKITTRMP